MKKQKFTVYFYEVVARTEEVEATSYEEALDKATDDAEVAWELPAWVQNNKSGAVKNFTETVLSNED